MNQKLRYQDLGKNALFSTLSFILLTMSLVLPMDQADARRPKLKKSPPISAALKELKWGESHFVVMKYLEKQIRNRFKPKIQGAYDGLKADQLRRDMMAEIEGLKDHYTEFNGQKTGYSVSFVKDDFAQNNGETMLKFDEGDRLRYYFFRYDELWKIVVSYPVMPDSRFEQLVDAVKKKYGRAKNTDWETPRGGSRQLIRSTWEDDKTRLVLEDKSAFYGCYVMKLMARVKADEIAKIHDSKRDKATVDLDAPQKIGGGNIDIYGEEENMDEVVDQITGTQHDVKLDRVDFVPAEAENVIEDKSKKKKKKKK